MSRLPTATTSLCCRISTSRYRRAVCRLVGHTGSGKKHARQFADGLLSVDAGEIRLDGRPLALAQPQRALRKGVAMVQQDPVVLADTFYANVTLGRPFTPEQVWEVLETVQLADLARGLSEGINTGWVSGAATSPSGKATSGAGARGIETPQVLILDEATASVTPVPSRRSSRRWLPCGITTTLVVIAHRLSTIVDADTILVLHRGEPLNGVRTERCRRAKDATGRCISCSWRATNWPPACAEESLSA